MRRHFALHGFKWQFFPIPSCSYQFALGIATQFRHHRTVTDYNLRGMPLAPYPINVQVVLEAEGQEISFITLVLFRQRDPVEGEIIRALTVMPPVYQVH